MALLERVATLLRANLNDLIDRAEEPEKMIRQVILDMENQLMQVKTQVAITIADLHLLEKRKTENLHKHDEWMRKAELAVGKQQDDLARIGIERALESRKLSGSFDEQIADQRVQVENLKSALHKLDAKLTEAKAKSELLVARQRRARAGIKASSAQAGIEAGASDSTFERMRRKVQMAEAVNQAQVELAADSIDDRFAALEKHDEVERLLSDLKERRA
jgi:phage shock protein A